MKHSIMLFYSILSPLCWKRNDLLPTFRTRTVQGQIIYYDFRFRIPEKLTKQTIMNALVKTIPVTRRGFLKCNIFSHFGWHYVNILMFGSKFLAIVTRFRDFRTSEKNRSKKKISRFQNTKYDFKAQISLFASKIISHVCQLKCLKKQ